MRTTARQETEEADTSSGVLEGHVHRERLGSAEDQARESRLHERGAAWITYAPLIFTAATLVLIVAIFAIAKSFAD